MRTSRSFQLSAAALLLGAASQAQAAFLTVENFNALTTGAIGGQNGWVVTAGDTTTSTVAADPADATNKVLKHTGINDAYKLLSTPIANASAAGTLFYRLRIAGLTNDVSFGLSDVSPPSLTDFATFEIQSNVTNTDGRFGTRDGGGNQTALFIGSAGSTQLLTLTTNVWYNVWIVADTTADTFKVYMQRDGDALLSTQAEIRPTDGTFNFRNGVAANPLQAFVILSNSANTNIYLDDISVDTTTVPNLANPTLVANPDADGDGLLDAWEVFYFGNSTVQNGTGDPDGDGSNNEAEETAGSNPSVAASTPNDTDGDGLLDTWELTYFTDKAAQTGSGDADGDGATNLQEQTASTDPVNAALWPNTDNDGLRDAWEITNFGNLTTATGSGDADSDGASNEAEMIAGSNPNDAASTPTKATLAHRWSFNGDLTDSVGTSPATIVDPDTNAAVGGTVTQNATSIVLTGGVSTTSAAVKLGANLIGGKTTPVTIELWASPDAVQNWGRIFDFGSGTTEYLFMSWSRGTNGAQDQVEWIDSGVVNNRPDTNGYSVGTKYHIVLTLTPAAYTNGALASGTRVTWYSAPSTTITGLSSKGTFDTANTLANLNDLNNWLGRSMWAGDNVAAATYDEVRIWNGALTNDVINTYQLAGPNGFAFTDTDGDGLSDPWETTYFGNLSENAAGDPDGDGHANSAEYNAGSNPTVITSIPNDIDGDGLPDNWENDYFGNLNQTASGDPDLDLATNLQEYQGGSIPNSPTSYPNSDGDLLNDAWELLNFGSLIYDENSDPDDDGYNNDYEFSNGLNPNNYLSSGDLDADTLPDGWEIHYFKLTGETGLADLSTIISRQDAAGDPDLDGFSNVLEYAFSTNPNSTASVPGDINNDGVNDGPLLKLGGDVLGTTSFNDGLNWHDAAIPVAGKTYIVSVNGLRTPTTGDNTFAGDRLVLTTSGTNVGTLIWKTDGAVTFPVLQFDGGMINQAATVASSVVLNGVIQVTKDSTLWANNGSFVINAPVSGTGGFTLTGNNVVTFAGAVTTTGNIVVPAAATATNNRLTLASTGSLRFTLGAPGVSNSITGAGAITLNGAFVINSAAVGSPALGSTWNLVATTGVKTYGATFSVTGFTSDGGAVGARKWISGGSAPYFQFDEATGVLTTVTNPDTDADGLLDTWETTYFGNLSRNGTADFDSDGSTDAQEFAAGTNPTLDTSWPDTDADGVKDTYELATFGNLTTATATDKDGDALLDAWELTYFTSIATQDGSNDSDGDGFTNLAEQTARSNPALGASVPSDINADGIADGHTLATADAIGTNSFVNGLNWSDAQAPVAGQNYLVAIQSLRTPADAAAYGFAGDRLVIFTGGNLLVKGSGVLTFPRLVLDGGRLHNATDGNVVATIEGVINVPHASEIYTQNQGFIVNAAISGTGDLTLTGPNAVTFAGVNTWKGSLALTNTAGFTLASTGSLVFAPGANGVTNAITGTNPATLNGTFTIDTSAASTVSGASWVLVATSGVKTYGSTFAVAGYTSDGAAAGARKWTSGIYSFDEATGALSVTAAPLSALETWRKGYFGSSATNTGSAADTADFDADGRSNLLEYAIGSDPTASNSGAPATVVVSGGFLTLSFNHIGDASISYVIQASANLVTWTDVQTYTGFTAGGSSTYTDNVSLTAGTRRFLRLQIVAPATP